MGYKYYERCDDLYIIGSVLYWRTDGKGVDYYHVPSKQWYKSCANVEDLIERGKYREVREVEVMLELI